MFTGRVGQNENVPTPEKPPFLYHGSAHKHIEELEPRNESVRDPGEGPVVFATQELALATIFMAAGVVESGKSGDVPYAVIVGTKEIFKRDDNGGHVYILPSASFEKDPNKGLGEYEWTSKKKIKPDKKIEYSSTLDAMVGKGVQVYFVDKDVHERIRESNDHGLEILKGLKSENQMTGVNIRSLD
ncbi:MAG: hypothetical protein WC250_00440 [Candidatus Paceibacterota bacterium]|jgi:hypothetical protein